MFVSRLLLVFSIILLLAYPQLGKWRTLYLVVTLTILAVVPAYRLSTTLAPSATVADLVSTDTRVRFYVLQATMEWLVGALLVLVDVRVWFFVGGERAQAMLPAASRFRPPHAETEGQQYQLDNMEGRKALA
ncbi:hypothetical protein CALVIDRAFT_537994 [Calocera viscosa TUFC12733]|uniref:Uncharacterized protein n=1 Tax=Calocera viscosa (strain TUFC12733) TaxID=1330018 RepID=A0A167LED9_CALVF|nr:hypothetical protein CALVIDRAFT_537994 [Calocera viscosa TUFC12733]